MHETAATQASLCLAGCALYANRPATVLPSKLGVLSSDVVVHGLYLAEVSVDDVVIFVASVAGVCTCAACEAAHVRTSLSAGALTLLHALVHLCEQGLCGVRQFFLSCPELDRKSVV